MKDSPATPRNYVRRKAFLLAFLLLIVSAASSFASSGPDVSGYQFAFPDPFRATVFGTPPQDIYKITKPVRPEISDIKLTDRNIPDIFWYDATMEYSVAMQKGEAPLIFVVAGTGSEHNSVKMRFLLQLFHQAGFHVVCLSSPTHMNFVISASEHAVPGYVPYDVSDLYRVMTWIKQDLQKSHKISEYYVTGYSLGGLHAAFLAKMDEEKREFDFTRAVMINPPVSLHSSVSRLDSWLTKQTLQGETPRQVIDRFIDSFSKLYRDKEIRDLDDNFLYILSKKMEISDKDLRVLIGTAFRLSSSSMIFASDVCIKAGYIVPPEKDLGVTDRLGPYARAAASVSFNDYMSEFLIPFVQYNQPGMSREQLVRECSLESIEGFLNRTDKVRVVGNVDDPILAMSDLAFLRRTFEGRATLFPMGGHCGNLMHTPFAEEIVRMVKE